MTFIMNIKHVFYMHKAVRFYSIEDVINRPQLGICKVHINTNHLNTWLIIRIKYSIR